MTLVWRIGKHWCAASMASKRHCEQLINAGNAGNAGNGLLCSSVRADRPLKREALLDEADGLDWRTAVRCDFM